MVILLGLAKDEILDRLPGRGKFNTAGNSWGLVVLLVSNPPEHA